MEGAALAAKRAFELALVTAYHTEAFARQKRLKSLSSYLAEPKAHSSHAHAVAFFHRLKARGVPVEITRH